MPDESFDEFLRRTSGATKRSPADVIAADEARPMGDAELDDALWMAFCGRVSCRADLEGLPAGARMYFATRIIEWEAASGGFEEALDCSGEYIDEALIGYELLGDAASVALWRRVVSSQDDEEQLTQLLRETDGPPWNGMPWGDAQRLAYVRANRDEFRIE